MGYNGQVSIWVAEIIPLCATLISFIYGLKHFFKKKIPLFLQSITLAMGCYALGCIYRICQVFTVEEAINGFTPAYLGRMGFFLFFITASYGQMDRIIDDGTRSFRSSRIIALSAPLGAILLYLPTFFAKEFPQSAKITYLIVWILGSISVYFNLKHAIIPDLDFGFVKVIKPYNVLALCLGFSELLCLTARVYPYNLLLLFSALLFSALSVATMIAGKKGVDKWTI